MVTKKAPRKVSERLKKKSSVATSAAAAKRDPAITVPSPPPKKGPNNNTAPSSSLRNLRYASRTQTVSSNPTSRSTEAIGEELPSEQVVTRLWSKGGIVKEIIAVQNESAKNRTIMGFGLRKSPPELNATPVITKSPTNSVAAAASTLIYQKNYVDSNSGTSGGNGGKSELYDNALEVNSSESSEDSEENECNANGSKEDDSSFHLEDNKLDKASRAKVTQGLVNSDDEAYLFEVESDDEFRTSFPKDLESNNIIQ